MLPVVDADWRGHEAQGVSALLKLAENALLTAGGDVDGGGVPSHVGFRSQTPEEWERLKEMFRDAGPVRMTYKPDGREIPFVELVQPLETEVGRLHYIELPAPKPIRQDEPNVMAVFHHLSREKAPFVLAGFEVRQQTKHARDFIERDKNK